MLIQNAEEAHDLSGDNWVFKPHDMPKEEYVRREVLRRITKTAAAGYYNLSLNIKPPMNSARMEECNQIKRDLEALGFKVQIRPITAAAEIVIDW